jgi:hypothetical protein
MCSTPCSLAISTARSCSANGERRDRIVVSVLVPAANELFGRSESRFARCVDAPRKGKEPCSPRTACGIAPARMLDSLEHVERGLAEQRN